MECAEYDFQRNPVVQNEVFFLESECAFCGVFILARSIEQLVEREQFHRTECRRANGRCRTWGQA